MMRSNKCVFVLVFLLWWLSAFALDAGAQWQIDGMPVATSPDRQSGPLLVADAGGGCYVVWTWQDGSEFTLYGQRIDAQGNRLWSVAGKSLCAVADAPYVRALIRFGTNEAIVVWDADRGTRALYAQRFGPAGSLAWNANGVLVSDAPGVTSAAIAEDGAGGAIVAWGDQRDGTDNAYAQRLTGSGTPQWGAGGVPVSTAASHQFNPRVVADGTGGAFVAWRDGRSGTYGLYAQRLTAAGAPAWAVDGIEVAASSFGEFDLEPDGSGGMIVFWTDPAGAQAQRLNASGQPLWGASGMLVAAGAGYVSSAVDGTGWTTIGFNRWVNASDADVFAQRLDSAGGKQWGASGVAVSARAGVAEYPIAVELEPTGAAIVTIACQDSTYRLQRLDANGSAQWGATGAAVSPSRTELDYRADCMALDGAGGAFVTWARQEGGAGNPPTWTARTYVRRVPASGLRTLSVDWGPGGRIDLLNPDPLSVRSVSVSELEHARFRITPDFGYFINDVVLDGSSLGVPPDVDLGYPTSDHTLYAGFSNGLWNGPAIPSPAGAYTTAAFPLTFTDGSVGSVLSALGAPDRKRWRLARWDPVAGTYAFAGEGLDTLRAGEGYWLVTADATTVTPSGKPITSSSVPVNLAGDAASGWNQVGNPYRFAIADTALSVSSGGTTIGLKDAANTFVDPTVWEWTGGSSYDSVGTLQPGRAYWVRKQVAGAVQLRFPNRTSTRATTAPFVKPAGARWAFVVTARHGEGTPARVAVGEWDDGAAEPLLLHGPPPSAGGGLSMRVRSAETDAPLLAHFDPPSPAHAWMLEITGAEAPGDLQLEVEGIDAPTGSRLEFADDARGWSLQVRPGEAVSLAAINGARRLRLRVVRDDGGTDFAAAALATIGPAYPNPFRERVGLTFRLAGPGDTRVEVFDLQGRRVRRLVSRASTAGEHVVVWDGRDTDGRGVPPGVYIARCEAAGRSLVIRLLRLR